jgi:heat-inducible transcriptional repressor
MKQLDLASRRDKILATITETYIAEARPVGSRTIARKLRFKYSPATIRNDMADLEEAGFITHPYTSAGRIPTDRGYRYYVDNLMPPEQLTPQEKKDISRQYAATAKELEALMEKTSRLLSQFSEEAGVVVYPCFKKSRIKHLELVGTGENSALMVILTNSGMVKNLFLDFPHSLNRSQLERISNLFNSQLEGVSLSEVRNYLLQKNLADDLSIFNLFKEVFSVFESAFQKLDQERLCFEGAVQIISQPEFEDRRALSSLLRIIEEENILLEIMSQDIEEEGLKVHIGAENTSAEIKSLSLVTANYHLGEQAVGSLGVIGPTRMAYSHILSVVDYISRTLEDILNKKAF